MKDIRQAVMKASAALKVLSEVVSELGAFAADALDTADAFAGELPTVPDRGPIDIPVTVGASNQTAVDAPLATSDPSIVQCLAPQCGTILLPSGKCPRCGWHKGISPTGR